MASARTTRDLTTVTDLLKQREWQACLTVTAIVLAEGGLKKSQEAFLYYARTRCLNYLDRYDAAIEAGHMATFVATEVRDENLLGQIRLELAYAQHKTPGLETSAVDTQRKFLDHFSDYTDTDVRSKYLDAHVNLAVYMRSASNYEGAYEQFKCAYREAKKHNDSKTAQIARSSAVWEALRLERFSEAETLMDEGKPYDKQPPAIQAANLLDVAQLALARDKPSTAVENVLKAMPLAEEAYQQHRHLIPRSLEILHRAVERLEDPVKAIMSTILAKWQAEEIDRQDMVAQLSSELRRLALQYPEAMEVVMASIDGEGDN